MFDALQPQAPDALLELIGLFERDPRVDKLDLGVGVYRDDEGNTQVMRAVKDAERRLLEMQTTKSYLGAGGDTRFCQLLAEVALGRGLVATDRIVGVQTPGGSGALRLAAELIAVAAPNARVWVGLPTWPNHEPILASARLQIATYRYFDPSTQTVLFDEMVGTFSRAARGDAVLLHGCCHNPTGADLTLPQWKTLAAIISERGLIPIIDLAYQGLGHSLDQDVMGVRAVLEGVEEALVAYSCDKNFGLYRDRTGALFAQVRTLRDAARVRGNMLSLVRVNWSMPPDHGAAAVRIILDDRALRRNWEAELAIMCARLRAVRRDLSMGSPILAATSAQNGMFALLPLSTDRVRDLRARYGIYMAGNGRINIAGLRRTTVAQFTDALAQTSQTDTPA